jgi:hypothetical protein
MVQTRCPFGSNFLDSPRGPGRLSWIKGKKKRKQLRNLCLVTIGTLLLTVSFLAQRNDNFSGASTSVACAIGYGGTLSDHPSTTCVLTLGRKSDRVPLAARCASIKRVGANSVWAGRTEDLKGKEN